MSNARFDVVFRGEIDASRHRDAIQVDLATKLKLSSAQAEKLLVSKHAYVKRGLEQRAAERYRDAFAAVGVIVVIEPSTVVQSASTDHDSSIPASRQ